VCETAVVRCYKTFSSVIQTLAASSGRDTLHNDTQHNGLGGDPCENVGALFGITFVVAPLLSIMLDIGQHLHPSLIVSS